ncbi:Gamma interferon inducible lysosomal thiol reductase GILT [Trinorchestia longiramus]|nr:Gamma interferon inducible lysosomal thiol reductase GILT [Trinorchestia longiramus]
MAGGKSKKAGPRDMIEYMTCRMWVDLESCKGLTEMSQSERNKLVLDCWKCMVDERVKMDDAVGTTDAIVVLVFRTSPTMSTNGVLCVVLCVAFLRVCVDAGDNETGAAKVPVKVYFESLCPDSKSFFRRQLTPAYEQLQDIMDLSFVPFGKALARPRLRNGRVTFEFECQHGQRECQGNRIMSCAQRVLGQHDQMRLFSCMMATPDPSGAGRQCTEKLGLDWAPIEGCSSRKLGAVLLYMNGRKTAALEPKLYFVPTVTIAGEYSRDTLSSRLRSFKQAVCDAYTGYHPNCA